MCNKKIKKREFRNIINSEPNAEPIKVERWKKREFLAKYNCLVFRLFFFISSKEYLYY